MFPSNMALTLTRMPMILKISINYVPSGLRNRSVVPRRADDKTVCRTLLVVYPLGQSCA
jgi:hypothetical protein